MLVRIGAALFSSLGGFPFGAARGKNYASATRTTPPLSARRRKIRERRVFSLLLFFFFFYFCSPLLFSPRFCHASRRCEYFRDISRRTRPKYVMRHFDDQCCMYSRASIPGMHNSSRRFPLLFRTLPSSFAVSFSPPSPFPRHRFSTRSR